MPPRHPELEQAIALSAAGRNAEAVLIITRLASQNDPGALATLAEMKWRGGMVPQNAGEGRELFRRAGEAGHVAAAASFTNLLASGVAGKRDWPQAMKRLKEEARGNPKRRQMLDLIRKMALTAEGDPVETPQGRLISESPHVTSFPTMLTPAECDYLRLAAEPGFAPSTVNAANGQTVADPMRTSDGSTFHWLIEDPAVHAFNRRLAAASGTGFDQGEAIQILRYRPGQQYYPHTDFVRASENQRFLTALVYLNHDYDGGETRFIKTGLKVKGRKGEAILFRNADAHRAPDMMAEHAGLPVTRGTKYLASRWIRETRWIP
jgi:prolyl 4-hydroxylase